MNGLLIIFDEERRNDILKDWQEYGGFSDALSVSDWEMKDLQICLNSFDGNTIHNACIGIKKRRVATAKSRVDFIDFVEFAPPISFDEIENQIGKKWKSHFINVSTGHGGRVPAGTWNEIWKSLIKLRPKYKSALLELLEKCSKSKVNKRDEISQTIAQEKDAVQLSLDISGFGRKTFSDSLSYQEEGELAPFLKGIKEAPVLEDRMIEHDMNIFGDWNSIKSHQIGVRTFRNKSQLLTIANVNRSKLEKTLGVDLIYYNHEYQSFVLVQYKRLLKESKDNFVCRPDAQFNSEKKRMEKFLKDNAVEKVPKGKPSFWYRLNPEIFYFKFCYEITFNPLSSDLISGFYLPLDYLNIYLNSGELNGPQGGTVISYETIGRYLHNTFFVDLVKKGWVGSRLKTTDSLTELINSKLKSGRSVMLARTKSL